MDLMGMFADGGPWMIAVLLLDVVLPPVMLIVLVLAIVSRTTNKVRMLALVLVLLTTAATAMPLCTGLVGWQYGATMTHEAAQMAPPEMKRQIQQHGREIAAYPLNFGCCSSGVLFVPMLLGLALTVRKRKRWQEVDDD